MSLSLCDVLLLGSLGGSLWIFAVKLRRLIENRVEDMASVYTEAVLSAFLWVINLAAMLSNITMLTATLFRITTFIFTITMMFFVVEHFLYAKELSARKRTRRQTR